MAKGQEIGIYTGRHTQETASINAKAESSKEVVDAGATSL